MDILVRTLSFVKGIGNTQLSTDNRQLSTVKRPNYLGYCYNSQLSYLSLKVQTPSSQSASVGGCCNQ